MNSVYKEWKEKHIGEACAKRPFFVGAPIKFVESGIDNPNYPPNTGSNEFITGYCEIVPSPEFDCKILDVMSQCRLLGAYEDCALNQGGNYQQNAASVSILLGNTEIITNAPCFSLINQLCIGVDNVYQSGDVFPSYADFYNSNQTGNAIGCELTNGETWKKHPLYVKAGEKLKFNFEVRYMGNASILNFPATYFVEIAKAKKLFVKCETVV